MLNWEAERYGGRDVTISIYEALRLPVMENTYLVAGRDGLGNDIKWVTIVEVLEDIHRLQQGELLVTTGYGMLDDGDKQKQFVSLLKMKKLSGVAIYTGFYLRKIPKAFIDAAEESQTPLIEIPTHINFSMITKAILEQIVNKQFSLLESSLQIHQQFTDLILNGQHPSEITSTLADMTSAAAVFIINDFYEVIEQSNTDDRILIDRHANLSIADTQLSLKQTLQTHAGKKHMSHHFKGNDHVAICPITARSDAFGWIVLVKPANTWRKIDEIAIGHAMTAYAIENLKQKAVLETQILMQGDFLEEIMLNHYSSESQMVEKGKSLGYDLTVTQVVFYFTFENKIRYDEMNHWINRLYKVIDQHLSMQKKQHMIRAKVNSILLLTTVSGARSSEVRQYVYKLASEIEQQWRCFFRQEPIKIGIGNAFSGVKGLSGSLRQAKYANSLNHLLEGEKRIHHYQDLGLYGILIDLYESGIDLKKYYQPYLEELIRNRNQGVDLIHTVEAYLLNNENIQLTSNKLFIHRHTLKYRLNQIEEKTGLNLKKSEDRMKLQLAVCAYRLTDCLAHSGT